MKKFKMSRELAYVLGLLIMPFAVAFTVRADLGMSMIASPTYIISEKVSFLSYGMTEYIVQALLLALMCIIIKKFRVAYLMSFASAVIYGAILDFACYITKAIPADNIVVRIVLFALGMVLTCLAVALFFNTYLAPCVYDFFVRVIGFEKKLDMRKWKLAFDFSMLIVSVVLSLVLFRRFIGVNFGTLIMAALNGNIIAFFSNMMKKHIEFFDRFPLAKYFEN
ncbi:MAG: hypothetical protein J1E36_01895 [Eubacterium sp.]|nr:hypothetical protein [Eubacterium sp.]